MPSSSDPVISKVQTERDQTHPTRVRLLLRLEKELGRTVVSYFTSFVHPVMIDDSDAAILEGILQKLSLENGLALMVSSPGGVGLAAERIINVCRSYSGTGEFWAIVPGKAKSAATMICFGASKILMGATSELGPIDPQVVLSEDGPDRMFSAYNVVQSYRQLFSQATEAKGNLEPYLQQLQRYDEREIAEMESQIALANDIATRTLRKGMMCDHTQEEVEAKIGMFLTPEQTKTHGRPIFRDEAIECGLKVEAVDSNSRLWSLIYELYVRTNEYVSTRAGKVVESRKHSFHLVTRGE